MIRKNEPAPYRYALQFRNGVWQIWDRHSARVVQAFGLVEAAIEHHKKFAPKGEGLDVRGRATVALAELATHRDELRYGAERKARKLAELGAR